MKLRFFAVAALTVAAGIIGIAAAQSARATVITYDLSATATWSNVLAFGGEDSGSIALAGTFSVDSVSGAVTNVNVTLSGGLNQLLNPPGSILVPGVLNTGVLDGNSELVLSGSAIGNALNTTPDALLLSFASDLRSPVGANSMTGVLELSDYDSNATTFSGSANPQVPEPDSLALLGAGLGGLGIIRRRKKA